MKKWEHEIQDEKSKHTLETNPQMALVLYFSDREFRISIITIQKNTWKVYALVSILQRKRTNMIHTYTHTHTCVSIYTHIYIHICIYKRRFIIEICSHVYGDWEVPKSAIYKLENQESRLYNLVWIWRPENQRRGWCNSQSEDKGLRTRELLVKSQSQKSQRIRSSYIQRH